MGILMTNYLRQVKVKANMDNQIPRRIVTYIR